MKQGKDRGFTLLEAVIVVITLGAIAAVATPMIATLVRGPESARTIESAALAQQQCAERILASRNATGYTLTLQNLALATNVCATLSGINGVTASVASASKTGSPCPSGFTCSEITITAVTSDSRIIGINPLTLLLVNY